MMVVIKQKIGANSYYIVNYIVAKNYFKISFDFKKLSTIISTLQTCRRGGMVDTSDSKSDVARRAGSSPAGGTTPILGTLITSKTIVTILHISEGVPLGAHLLQKTYILNQFTY